MAVLAAPVINWLSSPPPTSAAEQVAVLMPASAALTIGPPMAVYQAPAFNQLVDVRPVSYAG